LAAVVLRKYIGFKVITNPSQLATQGRFALVVRSVEGKAKAVEV